MLTSTQAAVLNNKIAGLLAEVGSRVHMPQSKQNTEGFAWDYMIASKIEKFGKSAKEKAVKEAIKSGVMFDHEKKPLAAGSEETVYSGDVVKIDVKVKQASESIDTKKLISFIRASGLIPAVELDVWIEDSTKTARPAHTFTAELLTD